MLSIRKNIKYKKVFKRRGRLYKNISWKKKVSYLKYGFFGLKVMESGNLTFKQLESARRCISRATKRKCKVWFRVFPDRPSTFKSKGSRMGKGVGKIGNWFFDAKAGCILLEISYIDSLLAKKALLSASKKLPLSTLILSRVKSKDKKFNYEISRFI